MIENITSQDLKNEISKILNKDISGITEDDLKKITRIALSKDDMFGKTNDYQISDLKYLKCIEECSLYGFEILDQDISVLNELNELKFLTFDFCDFNLNSQDIANIAIEELYLDKCTGLNLYNIKSSNLKVLSVIGVREEMTCITFDDKVKFNNLEVLEIHNYKINNILNKRNSLPNIKTMNLDGSIIEEKDALEILSKMNIEISNEEYFYLS